MPYFLETVRLHVLMKVLMASAQPGADFITIDFPLDVSFKSYSIICILRTFSMAEPCKGTENTKMLPGIRLGVRQ